MRINNNIQALNAYRNLTINQNTMSKHLEKLSSGLRINRASDDAAGLAISEKMRSQIRGLAVAERNSLDGISLIQTAEGALAEVHSMLQRMRELAVQSSNDTNTNEDREGIQKEVSQLINEVDRISANTEFNQLDLLNGARSSNEIYGTSNVKITSPTNNAKIIADPAAKHTVEVSAGVHQTINFGAENGADANKLSIVYAAAGTPNTATDATATINNSTNIITITLGANDANNTAAKVQSALQALDLTNLNIKADKITVTGDAGSIANPSLLTTAAKTPTVPTTAGAVTTEASILTNVSTQIPPAAAATIGTQEVKFGTINSTFANALTIHYTSSAIDQPATASLSGNIITIALGTDLANNTATNVQTALQALDLKSLFIDASAITVTNDLGAVAPTAIVTQAPTATPAIATAAAYSNGIDGTNNQTINFGAENGTRANSLQIKYVESFKDQNAFASISGNVITISLGNKATNNTADNIKGALQSLDLNHLFMDASKITVTTDLKAIPNILSTDAKTASTPTTLGHNATSLNNTLSITMADDIKINVSLSQRDYDGSVGKTAHDLAQDVKNQIIGVDTNIKTKEYIHIEVNTPYAPGATPTNAKYAALFTQNLIPGDKIVIGDQTYTAVEATATAGANEFRIGTGSTIDEQVASLQANIVNTLSSNTTFDASVVDGKIILEEKTAGDTTLPSLIVEKASTPYSEFVANPTADSFTALAKTAKQGSLIDAINNLTAEQLISKGYKDSSEASKSKFLSDIIAGQNKFDVKYDEAKQRFAIKSNYKLRMDESKSSAIEHLGMENLFKGLDLQIGANIGQIMNVNVGDMSSGSLGSGAKDKDGNYINKTLKDVQIQTSESANEAFRIIDQAIRQVSEQRSDLGAYQNRLEHTVNSLGATRENLSAAESRIRDTDMASQMSAFTKDNIINQAATAMLAQANQLPQGVLQLLKG